MRERAQPLRAAVLGSVHPPNALVKGQMMDRVTWAKYIVRGVKPKSVYGDAWATAQLKRAVEAARDERVDAVSRRALSYAVDACRIWRRYLPPYM